MSCDLALFDHKDRGDLTCAADPNHTAALARRADARRGQWSTIVRGSDAGGLRDYLDGHPIHCGAMLRLQAIEDGEDDYGTFSIWLPKGELVRYELAWGKKGERHIELHASVAGHGFIAQHEKWMRFAWPERGR